MPERCQILHTAMCFLPFDTRKGSKGRIMVHGLQRKPRTGNRVSRKIGQRENDDHRLNLTIEDMVLKIARRFSPDVKFPITVICWMAVWEFNRNLSYKQVRDALYRMREWSLIRHNGEGMYQWDVTP